MTTRKAWYDNNYEGKLLRYGLNKLSKSLKKAEKPDDIIKILNAVSTAANSKANLSKLEYMNKDIKELKELVQSFLPTKIIGDFVELPDPNRRP